MSFQATELRELAQVSLGGSGIETKMTDDFFCRNLVFIGHEFQNIDHFLSQRGLYQPFIDHFLLQSQFIDQRLRMDASPSFFVAYSLVFVGKDG